MRALALAFLVPSALFGATASVDLGPADASFGLLNSQRAQGTDGENDAVSAGPEGDSRSARRNRSAADDDFADRYLYFRVTDADVKASRRLRIGATFYDEAGFAARPAEIRLQYTNAAAAGPSDLPNTFSQHAYRPALLGRGRWVRFVWTLEDAGFRTFQQGTSDFRFDFGDAAVAVDRADVVALPERVAPEAHLVGAHYYPWYTVDRWNYRDCVTGALRLELDPAQRPALGRYDSSSSSVVDRHIRWCAEHGVNVLLLEFIAPGSREDRVSRDAILKHPRIGDLSFALMYDWAIRFGNGFELTPERIATAWSDFRHIAREYFPHPSHLKFAGAVPVVLIYVTRALSGDVDGLAAALRDACALEGFDVLLGGDEFFFVSRPAREKIARWDAIFGYDVYCGRGGYWGENGTLDLFASRTASYRAEAESAGVKFFPSCAPGFNDRAVRRVCADNPAFARRLSASAGPTSVFDQVFGTIALGNVDPELPLVCVTSFNEWHEDTQIEPTAGGARSTAEDSSPSGSQYTQGFVYDDYGTAYLEAVRDATVAVSGRVLARGAPAAGARIEVLDGEAVVLERASFSTGAYAIPRLRLVPGRSYRLRAAHGGLPPVLSEPFRVLERKTVTGFDLEIVAGPPVSRGDCNGDRRQDVSDAVALLGFLFRGDRAPPCLEACEVNGDRTPDLSDAVYLLIHIFLGGPGPAAPAFPACAPVEGALGCPSGNC
ncbi:MAG: hypothetical protein ACUVYA_08635 [Planctomycetota bacterium]